MVEEVVRRSWLARAPGLASAAASPGLHFLISTNERVCPCSSVSVWWLKRRPSLAPASLRTTISCRAADQSGATGERVPKTGI